MAVLTDIQAQLTRKATQITTTQGRIDVLEAAVAAGTASPTEILELDDLLTNVLPNLLSSQTVLNSIEAKLGVSVGTFGSMESIINSPDIFSSSVSTKFSQFNVPECTDGIIGAGNEMIQKMSEGIDSLISAAGQMINDEFGDDLAALQAYLADLTSFGDNFSSISAALDEVNKQFTKLAGIISAAMAANPCMAAVSDKLMSFQSPADQATYGALKTAVNDPSAKADIIKSAYSAIKLN